MSSLCLYLITALLILSPFSAIYAQTSASVSGLVKTSAGEALPGANVMIRNESTGFETGTTTNPEGRFIANQLPLGGPYSITVQFVGYGSVKQTGYTLRIGEQLKLNFALDETSAELQTVTVTPQDDIISRASPVGEATRLGVQEIRNMPTNGRSFQDLANLAPTVASGGNFAIGGTRESSTAITLDGGNQRYMMNGGLISSITVSMEAIREYEVSTNDYDVLEGRQGGGSVNVITKSGTNDITGSAFFFNRSKTLTASQDYNKRPIRDFNINQYGFSLGGPILRDKLHYFVALDFEDRKEPFPVIDVRPETERQEQISEANLNRFITILQDKYGLDPNQQQTGIFTRAPRNRTVFGRIDWQINKTHKLTFRNNYLWGKVAFINTPDQAGLFESWGNMEIRSLSSMLALRSTFSNTLTNEVKVQYLQAQRNFLPNSFAPRGFVNIGSTLADGSNVNRTFQFGGNRVAPEEQGEKQIQFINNTYLQKGKFFFTFGTDNILTLTHTLNTNEQGGLFQFASLDDLDAMKPAQYTRLVPLRPQGRYAGFLDLTSLDVSAYAQAEFNPLPNVNISGGVRWDATLFLTKPEYNPLVERSLGMRTDKIARDLNNFQPRLGITWDMYGDQTSVLKIGAGAFSANVVHWAQLSNLLQTGTRLTDISLTGANVPTPDFVAYRNDPSTVPGIPAGAAGGSPYVNIIGDDFQAPMTWKANLSYRKFFATRIYAGFNAYYARTVNNYVYTDLNLKDDFEFRLANEGGRGVYAPADRIQRANVNRPSVVNYPIRAADVNKNPELGRVLELNGKSDVWQRGVILEAGVILPKGGSLNATYTYNKTEDNNSYNCCIARTSVATTITDDPRALAPNRGSANTDFRHKYVVYGTSPKLAGFRLGFRYIAQAGSPWSPLVQGDITGDGAGLLIPSNKRAFIFNPETIRGSAETTPFELAVADGMETVLNNQNNIARELLQENIGKVAPRNRIYNPIYQNVDIRLSYTLDNTTIKALGKNSLEVIAEVFNFSNLLNKNWGGQRVVIGGNQVLLQNLGIDPLAEAQGRIQYAYRVNPTFGETVKNNAPYQVQLGVRYAF
jgi:hypothetical protein